MATENIKHEVEIGENAFFGMWGLTSIKIPKDVKKINSNAFGECANVSRFEYKAVDCSDLPVVNLALYHLGNSTSGVVVKIGSEVPVIPSRLFCPNEQYNQPKITNIKWETPVNCEQINTYAFAYATNLATITIPESIAKMETGSFRSCKNVTTVNFNATKCSDLAAYNLVFYELGISGTGVTVNIGANVKKIPAKLFLPDQQYGTKPKITTINWEPNSVCEEIGTDAFAYCSEFANIELPSSLKKIGAWVFHGCSSLTNIEIPAGVTSIGNYAFEACTSLSSITVLNPVPPTVGSEIFYGMTNFTIYVPSSSVNAYKSATNWSSYASRIQAIT